MWSSLQEILSPYATLDLTPKDKSLLDELISYLWNYLVNCHPHEKSNMSLTLHPFHLTIVPRSFHSSIQHIHNLDVEVRQKIVLNNENYKLVTNAHCRSQEFHIGNYILVYIHCERFSTNSFKKLHSRIGPFPIIQKLNFKAYIFDLSSDSNISFVFNVENLTPYHGIFEPPLSTNVSNLTPLFLSSQISNLNPLSPLYL